MLCNKKELQVFIIFEWVKVVHMRVQNTTLAPQVLRLRRLCIYPQYQKLIFSVIFSHLGLFSKKGKIFSFSFILNSLHLAPLLNFEEFLGYRNVIENFLIDKN